jgi:hydroxymethylpyrimidine/phosphomethylpyrimidine kinase
MSSPRSVPRALSIAGFDPCSFAGCTADLRTFQSLGVFGFSATTAMTVQSPSSFTQCQPINGSLVKAQIQEIFHCFGPIPVKIGLIPSSDCMNCVAESLSEFGGVPVILDPVLAPSAATDQPFNCPSLLAETLFPLCSLVTPNIPEAEALLNCVIRSSDEMIGAAEKIYSRFGCSVLMKGGHLKSDIARDILFIDGKSTLFEAPRSPLSSVHGSGCFLSSSITAYAALGFDLISAIRMAKDHISKAFSDPVDVGGFPLLYSGSSK